MADKKSYTFIVNQDFTLDWNIQLSFWAEENLSKYEKSPISFTVFSKEDAFKIKIFFSDIFNPDIIIRDISDNPNISKVSSLLEDLTSGAFRAWVKQYSKDL